jgi:hypothetical protein
MDFLSLLTNNEVAGFFITLAGQSILISITGLVLIKLLSKKSAPLRSLISVTTIIAMGLLIVIFIGARLSEISWQNEPAPVIEHVKISNVIAISDQYELASVIDKKRYQVLSLFQISMNHYLLNL